MSRLKLEHGSQLYTVPVAGGGYSCLGYEYAERTRRGVLEWCGLPVRDIPFGAEHYEAYCQALRYGEVRSYRTGAYCPALLIPELDQYRGKRVEVTWTEASGATYSERYWVGRSTGWLPINLSIKRRDSSGGGGAYFPAGATVRVVREAR